MKIVTGHKLFDEQTTEILKGEHELPTQRSVLVPADAKGRAEALARFKTPLTPKARDYISKQTDLVFVYEFSTRRGMGVRSVIGYVVADWLHAGAEVIVNVELPPVSRRKAERVLDKVRETLLSGNAFTE